MRMVLTTNTFLQPNYPPGTIVYINKNGQFHRTDGPATILPNGTKSWYVEGLRHREDGPAMIIANGHKAWYYKGYLLIDNNTVLISEIRYNDECSMEELQEFVIKVRPDLINQVPYLDSELKEKYAHELELGGVEI